MSDLKRRNALQLLALAPIAAAVSGIASARAQEQRPTLVAYFSRTGNTRVIANQIRRATDADLFEIVPATPYPEDYGETVSQARQETSDGFRPELQSLVDDIARYRRVYLGFPIWGTTAPPIIRSFLAGHDLAGKTVVPFITHGGFGTGSSLTVINEHAPDATFEDAFIMEADQERRTLDQVTGWLGGATP